MKVLIALSLLFAVTYAVPATILEPVNNILRVVLNGENIHEIVEEVIKEVDRIVAQAIDDVNKDVESTEKQINGIVDGVAAQFPGGNLPGAENQIEGLVTRAAVYIRERVAKAIADVDVLVAAAEKKINAELGHSISFSTAKNAENDINHIVKKAEERINKLVEDALEVVEKIFENTEEELSELYAAFEEHHGRKNEYVAQAKSDIAEAERKANAEVQVTEKKIDGEVKEAENKIRAEVEPVEAIVDDVGNLVGGVLKVL